MIRKLGIFALLIALGVSLNLSNAQANTVLTGQTTFGAFYKIVVPDNWNGSVYLFNHGFDFFPPEPDPDLGPLSFFMLNEGSAVAASSYSQSNWALFQSRKNLTDLLVVFIHNVGVPDEIFLYGFSLGGLVTAQGAEQLKRILNVDGALTMCGAVAGSRNWDGALDLRLGYDLFCGSVPGAAIPGGPEGLPASLLPADPATFGVSDPVTLAVDACFGIANPAARTPAQQARLDDFLALTQLPESFVETDMLFSTYGLGDLTHDNTKLAGRVGVGNENVDYGDPFVNANIQRVTPHPVAAIKLGLNYTPTGSVGTTKVISLHTDKDGLVIVENEGSYAGVVPASNLSTGIVVESTPTHCGFSPAEAIMGFDMLRKWVRGQVPQPTAADLQAKCLGLVGLGFPGPCRVDPSFVIPNIDDRIRPR